MSEVVREMIALGFQGVVVFILDLPPGAPGQDHVSHIIGADGVIADKGIVIQHLAIGVGGGEFGCNSK